MVNGSWIGLVGQRCEKPVGHLKLGRLKSWSGEGFYRVITEVVPVDGSADEKVEFISIKMTSG